MKNKTIEKLIDELGETYSKVLNIDLESEEESEIFKWFLASLLFGMPIREETAMTTYKFFVLNNVDTTLFYRVIQLNLKLIRGKARI